MLILLSLFTLLLSLSLLFGYHHHHHHYHFHYYYFFIIILVWRICIRHHNQSSNYYVILKHLHSSAEQLPLLNPCAFPTFPFSILTLLVTPWQAFLCFHPYPWDYYNNYMTPSLIFIWKHYVVPTMFDAAIIIIIIIIILITIILFFSSSFILFCLMG